MPPKKRPSSTANNNKKPSKKPRSNKSSSSSSSTSAHLFSFRPLTDDDVFQTWIEERQSRRYPHHPKTSYAPYLSELNQSFSLFDDGEDDNTNSSNVGRLTDLSFKKLISTINNQFVQTPAKLKPILEILPTNYKTRLLYQLLQSKSISSPDLLEWLLVTNSECSVLDLEDLVFSPTFVFKALKVGGYLYTQLTHLSLNHVVSLTDGMLSGVWNVLPRLTHLDLRACRKLTDKALLALTNAYKTMDRERNRDVNHSQRVDMSYKGLIRLNVNFTQMDFMVSIAEVLRTFEDLEVLKMEGIVNVSDKTVAELFPSLEGESSTSHTTSIVARKLKTLKLRRTYIRETGVILLWNFWYNTLENLDISHLDFPKPSRQLTDFLQRKVRLANEACPLVKLNVLGTKMFEMGCLEYLSNLQRISQSNDSPFIPAGIISQLTKVRCYGSAASVIVRAVIEGEVSNDYKAFDAASALEELDISTGIFPNFRYNEIVLSWLDSPLPKLRIVNISNCCGLDPTWFIARLVENAPNLEYVYARNLKGFDMNLVDALQNRYGNGLKCIDATGCRDLSLRERKELAAKYA